MKKIIVLALSAVLGFALPAQADSVKSPTTKKSASKKKKKRKIFVPPSNRKVVPIKDRLIRDWGLQISVQGFAGTMKQDLPVKIGTLIGGYKCFLAGKLCAEAGFNFGFVPQYWWGMSGGVRWNPFSNRHWLTTSLKLSFLSFPVGYDNDTQWTIDLSAGVLWRAFGDYASSSILTEIVVKIGGQNQTSFLFGPSVMKPVIFVGLRFSLDLAMYQKHRDGRGLSVFTGRSPYDPKRSRGIHQNTQVHQPAYRKKKVRRSTGPWVKYRGVKLPALGDADKDGTLNMADKCPVQKGPAKFMGCPEELDTDDDDVPDYEDKYPFDPKRR